MKTLYVFDLDGTLFGLTCMNFGDSLELFCKKYCNKFHCILHEEIYTKDYWLDFILLKASKANSIMQLKKFLNCDKVIVFGDGKNDIDMFRSADECYAVDNAVDELKQIATDVIGSNDDDGVAKWLDDNILKMP